MDTNGNVAGGILEGIRRPYQGGRDGPGGWWILVEREVHLGEHVLVPDLAGWRRERMPSLPEGNWTDIVLDRICEIISPSTARLDRITKMRIYAEFGVPHVWLLDPGIRTLEVCRLESGRRSLLSSFAEDDKVRAEPFDAVQIELKDLWA